jgi:hypothetical protein
MTMDEASALPPSLEPRDREELETAIRKAYNEAELGRVLLFEWGIDLPDIVSVKGGYIETITQLVSWTERQGKTWDLFGFLYRRNPKNLLLAAVAHKRGVAAHAPPAQPKPSTLEALVQRSKFINIATFEKQFGQVARRLCKVITPTTAGTGFLIASDTVLTAFHVVESVSHKGSRSAGIACLFDYSSGGNKGHRCETSGNWLVEHSPVKALDFALIRISKAMGDDKDTKPVRGWFKLSEALEVVNRRDLVLVPQHPRGRPQEVAWGEITDYAHEKPRVCYDASTDKGSSGSPCLTADLKLFGLHTQAGAGDNQGVPIRLVAAQLRQNGLRQKGFDV